MKPYAHQQRILNKNPQKYLIAHACGLGKTQTALFLAEKNNVDALIIVPKALKENWMRACAPFSQNHRIVTKEEFRRDWEDLAHYNCLIIDEFHYFANLKSQLSKALGYYIKTNNPTFIWGLTATPFCSSPMNIYALAKHLGYMWNYYAFVSKFFYQVQMGHRMIPMMKTGIEGDVAQLVKQIGDTCTMEECVDVPDQTFETVWLSLVPEQMKAIKAIDDSVAIARWTRQHTIENGLRIGDEYTKSEIYESAKTDYIVRFAEENRKFSVICRYNSQIDMLYEALQKEFRQVYIIRGETKNRDEVVQQIERCEECIVLIQADCAVGFEIPSVPIMIFASLSFSFVSHEQSIGRIHRINKLKKNVYQYLIIKGGVDEAVYDCIMKKQDFNIAIYANDKSRSL